VSDFNIGEAKMIDLDNFLKTLEKEVIKQNHIN
jgi:hypothetical protein